METIRQASSSVMSEQRNVKGIIINLLALVLGITLTFTAGLMIADSTSALYLVVVTSGVVVAIIFAIKLIGGSRQLVYTPTGSQAKEVSLFFKTSEIDKLTQAIVESDHTRLDHLVSSNNSGIRLDVIMSKDGQFSACQIMRYVPYCYEPASAVYHVSSNFCSTLIKLSKSI